MHGYRVTRFDGTEEIIEADGYVVNDDGVLEVHGGGTSIATFDLASWVDVNEVGQKLSNEWPYSNMRYTVNAAVDKMAKYGYIPSGPLPDFDDWRMNDFDSVVAAIVGADGIDIDTSDKMQREIVHLVGEVIANEFSLRWRKPNSK